MNLTWKPVLTAAALTVSLTAGCSNVPRATTEDPWGSVEVRRQQNVRIGVVSPASDEAIGAAGTDVIRGIQLAVEDYGRIHGFGVELVTIESQCSEAGGRSGALSLASDETIAVVLGPICSTACQGAIPILDEKNLTIVSPSCGATDLTDQSLHNDAFLRTIYEDRLEGHAAAEFAYVKLGARRAALIGDATIQTSGYLDAFENTFTELGGTIATSQTIESGDTDMRPVLNAAAAAELDVIYAPLLPHDAATLTVQKAGTEFSAVPIIGGRHYRNSEYVQESGITAEGVYAAAPHLAGDDFTAIAERYEEEFQEQPATQEFAFAYDAAQVVLDAISKTARSGPRGSLLIGKQALREVIYQTSTFNGLTGTLTCSSFGDCSAASISVYEFDGIGWNLIYVP